MQTQPCRICSGITGAGLCRRHQVKMQRRALRNLKHLLRVNLDENPFAQCEQETLDRAEVEFPVLAEGEE